MAEKERSFWNWVGNVVTSPWKMLHTWGCLLTDTVNTATWFLEDLSSSAKTTANQIANCFSFDKKWYQKILNIPVAAWIGLAWVIKALVAEPILNTGSRAGKTVLNATTNTFKSTLWSWFSARPVSDISFNTLKTKKKWVIKIDTSKFILDPNKSWVPNRWTWSKHKKRKISNAATTAAAAWTATAMTAATAAAISNREISNLKGVIDNMKSDFEGKMKEMEESFSQRMSKVLKENDALKAENKGVKQENEKLKKTLDALQKEKAEKKVEKKDEKEVEKKVEESKVEKKEEDKPVEVEKKDEPKNEKKEESKTEKKEETKVEKKDEWEVKEKKDVGTEKKDINDSNRIPEFIKDSRWKTMVHYLNKIHPEIRIRYNKSDDEWHLYWKKSWNKIVVWTKNAKEVPQILLHEIAHVLINDKVDGVDHLLSTIAKINKSCGKQLFSISNNNKDYPKPEDKKIEDACELIALYARWDWAFDKYMSELQSWKNEKLAKLDKIDVNYLRQLCDDIIIGCDDAIIEYEDAIMDDDEILDKKIKKPEAKTVKMFEPVSKAA